MHAGSRELTREFVDRVPAAVSDKLWILDSYAGNAWAIGHLTEETRTAPTADAPVLNKPTWPAESTQEIAVASGQVEGSGGGGEPGLQADLGLEFIQATAGRRSL